MTDTPIRRSVPADGDLKRCPQCGDTLILNSRYPVLTVRVAQDTTPEKDRLHYERAWVCRNGGCDYRELLGDAAKAVRPLSPDSAPSSASRVN